MFVWGALWAACTSGPQPSGPPLPLAFEGGEVPTNLLMISLDTTRRDRIGHLAQLPTTPFLDARMAEGVVLGDHRSCSNWTAPSMICATTGLTPLEQGFWPGSGDPEVEDIPAELPSLARILSGAGWQTRLVTANPVFSDRLGAGDGFEHATVLDFADAGEVLSRSLPEAAQLIGAGPWYLHLHFVDPHRPYCPPPAYRGAAEALPPLGFDVCGALPEALEALEAGDEAYRALLVQHVDAIYRGAVRYLDDVLAQLWSELDAMGLLDDVLVVFLTDHGEQLMERGVFDHGYALYAEESRAAAGLWARTLAPGSWWGPTLHQDLAATLFELYDVDPGGPVSGIPLGSAPDDRAVGVMAYSWHDAGAVQLSVVHGDRQLHTTWDGGHELYELDTDPGELHDVYRPDHPDLEGLWAQLRPLMEQVEARWPHLGPPAGP
ncbi:MAG TPA: hypothetical protein ENK18_02815 [Deltaproteobacteria bacterium]|nr:hypothetical protein [Deltaproteobacteria bacterium]